jgi:hypothetical protein
MQHISTGRPLRTVRIIESGVLDTNKYELSPDDVFSDKDVI